MNKEKVIKFCETALITKKRDNGEEYVCFNEETEFKKYWKEIKDLLYKAGFKIEDFYYSVLDEALYSIAGHLKLNYKIENYDSFEYAEADIYLHDLLKWLGDSRNSTYYCDEALREFEPENFTQLLQYAQENHKREIYAIAIKLVEFMLKELV